MHLNSIEIDSYALCSALTASSSVEFGKQVHTHVVKMGFLSSVYVGSALIDLYARVGLVRAASNLFDEIPVRSTVCANALISGFVESKMWGEGLGFSRRMSALGLGYDGFTLCAVLRVCTGLSAVGLGKEVHAVLISTVCDVGGDVFLQSSLIEMYGKSGFVDKARYVFDLEGIERVGERKRDVVLWTTMLGVYSRNGKFEEVIELYGEMLGEGTKPDRVVFVAVISACGNTGNVSLGLEYFNSMVRDFGLEPQSEHYGCVVNMLCRTGKLDKAWKLVNKMPFEIGCSSGSISMWGALLSACAECGNVEMGKLAAKRTLELDPQNVGIYVLLSNLYAGVGMWDEIRELRKVMQEKGLKKDVGYSWVDVNRKLI
ncbi:hypothetical protein GIB67_007538 [Kingdonia uniflora]|uniref:Pentatricopeptide repeat-containing protein n=1 Tax=Kingdonia uniflora TaxID=39325 RepID=A0A7J7LN59_9MAGN|nr:hypothetical protein GIB67_007538 [Kingdonia uniflora]